MKAMYKNLGMQYSISSLTRCEFSKHKPAELTMPVTGPNHHLSCLHHHECHMRDNDMSNANHPPKFNTLEPKDAASRVLQRWMRVLERRMAPLECRLTGSNSLGCTR